MHRDSRQVYTEWLVLAAQAGDERAFRDLYGLWTADLQRLARVRVEHAQHAEEVMQDAWVAIARGLGRLDDPARFPAWAMRIVERRGADWVRRRQLERHRRDLLASAPPPDAIAAAPRHDLQHLREVIDRLTPDDRQLLHLFYHQGLSVGEVAEVLGVPAGTVKSRLFHTREKLRTHLERNPS